MAARKKRRELARAPISPHAQQRTPRRLDPIDGLHYGVVPPAPPPPPPLPPSSAVMQWLALRVSFSLEDVGGCGGGRDAGGGGGAGKVSADFEFLLADCSGVSTMLPADELFSGGKLVTLRLPSSSGSSSEAAVTAMRPPLAPRRQRSSPRRPGRRRHRGRRRPRMRW
ncbi:formin-like protein 5 [Hordeum vulgare]|nr:formin-like protein 5 [Hordeum vulgare]KAI4973202.1 hypothetical protein ZWY2020_028910 [Hordeum vulgare]